jgi:hypothetical protein
MGGLGTTATAVISVWVIVAFLLLPAAGSLRYWTAAFVLLTIVVAAGDHLATRALLAVILGLHVLFVVPVALIGDQRWRFWTAPVSLVLLAGLVIAGGRHYWLPALVTGLAVGMVGAPLLWIRLRHRSRVDVEVRGWPRLKRPAGHEPAGAETAAQPLPEPSEDPPATSQSPEPEPRGDRKRHPPPRNKRAFPPQQRNRPPGAPAPAPDSDSDQSEIH